MIVNAPARPIALTRRLKRLWRALAWLTKLVKTTTRTDLIAHSPQTEKLMQQSSQDLLNILNVRVELHGKIPDDLDGMLVVANHVSWLDILAMVSVHPMQFIAKQEIASWPVLGKIVSGMGTVFINRNQRKDTAKINSLIAQQLKEGQTVAFFPEARTSDGKGLRTFKGALFQAAIDSHSTVLPISLRYFNAEGKRSSHAAFIDGVSLFKSLWLILSEEETVIRIDCTAALPAHSDDIEQSVTRFHLREKAQHQVAHLVLDDRDLKRLSEWNYL